jgi:hypothetical protein
MSKVLGALISAQGLEPAHIRVPVDPLLLRHGLAHEVVIDHRVTMNADGTVFLKDFAPGKRHVKTLTSCDKLVAIFDNFQRFFLLQCPPDLARI